MRKRWWILIGVGGSAFIGCSVLNSVYHAYPEVAVANDLDFDVALMQCGRNSVWNTDPVFISAGEKKGVHAGPKCFVHGPTGRSGPLGFHKDIGPYIGCLVIGPGGEAEAEPVLISSSAPGVDCD